MGIISKIDGHLGKLDEWYFSYFRFRNRDSPRTFHCGWGSRNAMEAVSKHWNESAEPAPVSLDWKHGWQAIDQGVACRDATFLTPVNREFIPPESWMAGARFLKPSGSGDYPVVVLMPTSREAGFAYRMAIAHDLARHQIGSVLLDSPFMGRRKPASQFGQTLSHLSDFLILVGACIEEGKAVVRWLREHGISRICCAGISQGAYVASSVGLNAHCQTSVAAILPPHSGAAVFVDGILSELCDWRSLQTTSGSDEPVRDQMHRLFAATSLDRIPSPSKQGQLTLVAARQDRYVRPSSYARLACAWGRGQRVRWLSGGHVSTIVERQHFRQAIFEALVSGFFSETEESGDSMSANAAMPSSIPILTAK